MVALAREIKEEINADIEVGQFRGAIENAWDDQSEISLIFEVKHSLTKNVTPKPASPEEEHLEFLWVHIDQLCEHTLLPTPLVTWLQNENHDLWASTIG
jgi:8-oxo-dGTP pyrophosphatase MutT (NUDIX family)